VLLRCPGSVGTGPRRAWLAEQLHVAHIRVDTIERALIDAMSLTSPAGPVGYLIGYAIAAGQLRNGVSVVADSVNPLAVTRAAWRDVGARHSARTVDVEIVCSDSREHRHRVETRPASIPGLRLLTWQEVLDREYQPWDHPPIVIDTATASAAACVSEFRRRANL
jgi:predicted kinase